jgi:N-acetylglucosamine-6-phosphate deacetylase
MTALVNGRIFTGESLLHDHVVILEGGKIKAVLPECDMPAAVADKHDLQGLILAPGFIDLQVNGGGGVMFNAEPTVDTLRVMADAHRRFGTTGFLPTLVSDSFDVMRRGIAAVEQALEESLPGVLGIHLEGPFLNPERKGVHDARHFRDIDSEAFDLVTSLPAGVTLLTVAPECTLPETISRLVEAGVIVSAGHSAASFEQVQASQAAGLSGFTHLYNAMTPLQGREPGVVGAALAADQGWFGIIADGHHVHPASLKIAVRAREPGSALLVTDAMASVGTDLTSFEVAGQTISVSGGRCTTSGGVLAGSDLDMNSAVVNAMEFTGVDWMEAVRMASCYPAKALGLAQELGAIRPGCRANLVALDNSFRVTSVWVDGVVSGPGL